FPISILRHPPTYTLFPYTTLFRSQVEVTIDYPEYDDVEELSHKMMQDKTKEVHKEIDHLLSVAIQGKILREGIHTAIIGRPNVGDRKSTRLNSSHVSISYAVFCLK